MCARTHIPTDVHNAPIQVYMLHTDPLAVCSLLQRSNCDLFYYLVVATCILWRICFGKTGTGAQPVRKT